MAGGPLQSAFGYTLNTSVQFVQYHSQATRAARPMLEWSSHFQLSLNVVKLTLNTNTNHNYIP